MFVYMMTNKPDGTLYIGVTKDLVRRVHEHRTHAVPGFTDRYNLERLVWFEQHDTPAGAIRREKALKRWYRAWKVALIEKKNPAWRDLWDEIVGASPTMTDRAHPAPVTLGLDPRASNHIAKTHSDRPDKAIELRPTMTAGTHP
jgi:putative endonuclease